MPLPIWDGAHRRAAADAGEPAHQSPAEGSIPSRPACAGWLVVFPDGAILCGAGGESSRHYSTKTD